MPPAFCIKFRLNIVHMHQKLTNPESIDIMRQEVKLEIENYIQQQRIREVAQNIGKDFRMPEDIDFVLDYFNNFPEIVFGGIPENYNEEVLSRLNFDNLERLKPSYQHFSTKRQKQSYLDFIATCEKTLAKQEVPKAAFKSMYDKIRTRPADAELSPEEIQNYKDTKVAFTALLMECFVELRSLGYNYYDLTS